MSEALNNEPNPIETYHFDDGDYSFWQAVENGQTIIFRVRSDRRPSERAQEKGISRGSSLEPANPENIRQWLASHPEYKLLRS